MRLATALTATEFTEDNRAVQMGSPLEQQALRCTVDQDSDQPPSLSVATVDPLQ